MITKLIIRCMNLVEVMWYMIFFFLQLKHKAQQWASPVTARTDSVDMTSSFLLVNTLHDNRRKTGANNENKTEEASEHAVYLLRTLSLVFWQFQFRFRVQFHLKQDIFTHIFTLWTMKMKWWRARTLELQYVCVCVLCNSAAGCISTLLVCVCVWGGSPALYCLFIATFWF